MRLSSHYYQAFVKDPQTLVNVSIQAFNLCYLSGSFKCSQFMVVASIHLKFIITPSGACTWLIVFLSLMKNTGMLDGDLTEKLK